jgi:hypothetical protein
MRRFVWGAVGALVLTAGALVAAPMPARADTTGWIMWYPELGGGGYCMFQFCNPAGLICCRIIIREE